MWYLTWLALGVFNWAILCFYRIWTDNWPWNEPLMSFVRGFALVVALGPLTPFILYALGEKPKLKRKFKECNDLDISEFT